MAAQDPDFVPEGVDLEHPNPARIYDWFLGGTANWAIDREFGARAVAAFPGVRVLAKVGREFLGRGVQYLAEQGVNQFLDLGSGVPTVGNVHEIADEVNPGSRCVYVDIEPVAVAHSKVLLEREGDPKRHAVIQGDLRDPETIWRRALDTGVLDPSQPIGLIVVGVLYFVGPEDNPHAIIGHYRDLLPSGSYFLCSHLTVDDEPTEEGDRREEVRQQYRQHSTELHMRDRAEFTRFFDGWELVDPGVVWIPQWRPDLRPSPATREFAGNPSSSSGYAGLGRKP
ncbi:SAM-dependent methyltransferase [Amycolatopsis suaedae]|uniref:Methyltransferase n=1 Tax=Amycolatopsis suaedae TaxID=2510978 RepID=A0A4V2EMP0_9PSEU|nr:SAM-dependent methyltransferase [Amycolatopsis suaedae]RZQ65775.1 methyltransferase [Amycolatopsis suaedae]